VEALFFFFIIPFLGFCGRVFELFYTIQSAFLFTELAFLMWCVCFVVHFLTWSLVFRLGKRPMIDGCISARLIKPPKTRGGDYF
jgi:hypothetical protein